MRQTIASKSKAPSWQSRRAFNLQPSPHRSSATSNRSAYSFLTASPPKAYWQPLKARGGQIKRLCALLSQAEGLQISADLQVFTSWLIESGVEGISGDIQKVEIYQYGEDGRGLRATTVPALLPSAYTLRHSLSTGQRSTQDVRAYDKVLS